MGNISGYEAKKLITSSLPGINMLCNTIVLASATILALLLTLLGISSGSKSKLKREHYTQVMAIAKLDTVLFVIAIILFQILFVLFFQGLLKYHIKSYLYPKYYLQSFQELQVVLFQTLSWC